MSSEPPGASQRPQPPAAVGEEAASFTSVALAAEDYYHHARFEGVDLSEQAARHVVVERALFREVSAAGAELESLRLTDTTLPRPPISPAGSPSWG